MARVPGVPDTPPAAPGGGGAGGFTVPPDGGDFPPSPWSANFDDYVANTYYFSPENGSDTLFWVDDNHYAHARLLDKRITADRNEPPNWDTVMDPDTADHWRGRPDLRLGHGYIDGGIWIVSLDHGGSVQAISFDVDTDNWGLVNDDASTIVLSNVGDEALVEYSMPAGATVQLQIPSTGSIAPGDGSVPMVAAWDVSIGFTGQPPDFVTEHATDLPDITFRLDPTTASGAGVDVLPTNPWLKGLNNNSSALWQKAAGKTDDYLMHSLALYEFVNAIYLTGSATGLTDAPCRFVLQNNGSITHTGKITVFGGSLAVYSLENLLA